MPLNWQAAQIGHYSDIAVSAMSESYFDIDVSSYNQVIVKAYKFSISNFNNKSALEIYFDNQPAVYIQPFTNIALDCFYFKTVRIVNRGKKKISGQFIDRLRYNASPSLFSSAPIQIPASGNDILMHFDDAVDTNDGNQDLAIQAVGGTSLDTSIKKFGNSSLLCASGAIVGGRSDFIDLSKDFTTDCWVYLNGVAMTAGLKPVFHVGYDDAAGQSVILYLNNAGATMTPSLYLNGSVSNGAGISINDKFTHIALSKNQNTVRVFINGSLSITAVQALTGARSSVSLFLDNTGKVLSGNVDEWRYINNICQWVANFTPPTAQYL